MLFAWVKVVVESLLLHSGAQKFWNVTKSANAVFLSNKKLAYIMRKHYKNCIHFIPAKNCPWDLVSIKYRTHLCNILPKLRHLTKIGYSSRFCVQFQSRTRWCCARALKLDNFRSDSVQSKLGETSLESLAAIRTGISLQNVSRCGKNYLTASLLSTKGLIEQRLKTKYARKTCHVVLLLKAALWSKKVKSNSSTLRSPLGRSLTTNPMSSAMKDKYLIDNWTWNVAIKKLLSNFLPLRIPELLSNPMAGVDFHRLLSCWDPDAPKVVKLFLAFAAPRMDAEAILWVAIQAEIVHFFLSSLSSPLEVRL